MRLSWCELMLRSTSGAPLHPLSVWTPILWGELERQPNESSIKSAAVPQREGCGTGSLTEEGFSAHRLEVLGGTHQVRIKEGFFTIRDLTLRGSYSELPALSKW